MIRGAAWLLGLLGLCLYQWAGPAKADTGPTYGWSKVGFDQILLRMPVGPQWQQTDEELGALTVLRQIHDENGDLHRIQFISVLRHEYTGYYDDWLPEERALAKFELELGDIYRRGVKPDLFDVENVTIGESEHGRFRLYVLTFDKIATDYRAQNWSREVSELYLVFLSNAQASRQFYTVQIGIACMVQRCGGEDMDMGPLRQVLDLSERLTSADIVALLEAGANHEALALANNLLEHRPYSSLLQVLAARAEYQIGRGHIRDNQCDRALVAIDNALARLASVQLENRDGAERRKWMARLHYRRGHCLRETGQMAEAMDAFRSANTTNPNHHGSVTQLGYTATLIGDYSQALLSFESVMDSNPGDETNLNNMAWLLVSAGLPEDRDPDLAEALLKNIPSDMANAARFDTLGATRFRQGRPDDALKAYSVAVRASVVYAANAVNDLAETGCADPAKAGQEEFLADFMIRTCLSRGFIPYYFSENLRRVEYLLRHDPENARRHIEAMEAEYPAHPAVIHLRAMVANGPTPPAGGD